MNSFIFSNFIPNLGFDYGLNISIGLKGLINYRDSPAGRISKSMNRVLIHEVGLVLISLKSRQLSWFAVIFNWDH
jgi:hypothetical protein